MNNTKKGKVSLITFHFPYNCGAVLQCYASQTVMERGGYDVEVINYVPWYHRHRYTPFKNPFTFAPRWMKRNEKRGPLAYAEGFARAVYSWRRAPKIMPREKKFYAFINKNLHLTRMYRTIEQLRSDPPAADAYVCGSDQLWNVHITEGFDEAYALRFGADKVRRIGYAVGADFTEAENPEKELPAFLSQMDAIALRETKCWDAVKEATGGNTPMCVTIDPTLLLDKTAYASIEEKPENAPEPGSYVLTYVMPNESARSSFAAAEETAQAEGLAVIDVSGNPLGINRLVKDNRICSPGEFLWYVRHARYVFTNSFHGTVFSVIYEKAFMTIPHTNFGNRTSELLEKLGIPERIAKDGIEAARKRNETIDYAAVQAKIEKLRADSLEYLFGQLQKKQ